VKIGIPVLENNGMESEIAPHFGHVVFLAVYDSESEKLEFVEVDKTVSGCSPVLALAGAKVDAIYSCGLGMRAIEECKQRGIILKTGNFRTVDEVIKSIDSLEDLTESCGH